MRRSVLILIVALAAVRAGAYSTSAQAQASKPDTTRPSGGFPSPDGSSVTLPDGRLLHRPAVHYPKSEQPWLVGAMKMLAPGKGWAMTDHGLFWTVNGGRDWKDITPRSTLGPDAQIKDIFFLDARHGWVLFAKYDEPEPKFDLARTDNTGATWSVSRVHVDQGNLAADGQIRFADPLHGGMVLNASTSSAIHAGSLFLTSDGGRTWRNSPDDPGGQGPILPVTPKEGWLVGNGQDDDLHVTWDGAKTWQTVSLPAPKEIYPAIDPTADVPVFEDEKHGFVAVTYSGSNGVKSAAVLFATVDGGHSWAADRVLTNLEEGSRGELRSTVADSIWITARV